MPISNLKFGRSGASVYVEGKTKPDVEVRAENLSASPFAPSDYRDDFAPAKADADGRFHLPVPTAREGDQLRLSCGPQAGVDMVTVRVRDVASVDGRRPEMAQQALRLLADGDGVYRLHSVSKNPRVCEPGTILELTNQRTKEQVRFELDDEGMLPADVRLQGQAGDCFRIAASDGANNKELAEFCSSLVAPPDDDLGQLHEPPPDRLAEGRSFNCLRLRPFGGPLYVDGVDADDPIQGRVGDCYLVSGASAIAAVDPEAIQRLFTENDDGTVTVGFKAYDHDQGRYVERPITVSRELYTGMYGTAYYGCARNSARPADMELWFPLLEKAYAAWKGGYDGVGAGVAYEVYEALLGMEGRHFDTEAVGAEVIFSQLKRASRKHEPVVTWTHVDSSARPFINTGLSADHAYTVLGVEEKDGKRLVRLRNPWGENPGNGTFSITLEGFVKYFAAVGIARS